ncbi:MULTISPECIES: cell wall synthase accessory phosphoprotein MacP [Enterococcus]|uniref:Uncharacterized protein n=1 Tax=Enterococcus sulfureus ATCC 49903 TaxID=1140003 RepID=S0P1H7_9ENTE|nr:cell wall synthase accessory phosphoprotein MacP [Enterococcus sulfureus]EOT49502.1 hypothetical protein OMY_00430 [Enterococcus sulfureus ATCC 49903]EOT87369.1 hypothetical protein I573_00425 [Enterococcus sulfureus ATCC 49903]
MSKRPLVTRSELRRQKRTQGMKSERAVKTTEQSKPVQQMKENSGQKKAGHFYRKPYQKKEEKSVSRSKSNQRSREMNTFLMKSIGIVAVLLVLVILAIIYL